MKKHSMKNTNSIVLCGNIATDVETSGPFLKFNVAVNQYSNGQKTASFFPVEVYGTNLNDDVRNCLTKGHCIYIGVTSRPMNTPTRTARSSTAMSSPPRASTPRRKVALLMLLSVAFCWLTLASVLLRAAKMSPSSALALPTTASTRKPTPGSTTPLTWAYTPGNR